MATYYWVGGSGTWDAASTANWSASSGGAGGSGPPLAADTVIFDANSGSGTCTTASSAVCAAATLNSTALGLTLGADLTMSGLFTLTQGALDLGGFTLSSGTFLSNNANTRSIDFGAAGVFKLTAQTGNSWDIRDLTGFSCSGSKSVVYEPSTGVSQGTIFHRGLSASEGKAVSLKVICTSGVITMAGTSLFLDIDLSQAITSGSLNTALTIYGSLRIGAQAGFATGANAWTFAATTGINLIETSGLTIDWPLVFNGVGGTWQLADNLTIGATRVLTLTNGTLDANNKNVILGSFALGAGTKTLTLGNGTWAVVGSGTAWNANTNVANLTVSPSSGIISMTSASAKTFSGGAKAWPTLRQGGAGALTIQQSNSFANITNSVQPATITLTSGTTQTVAAFGVSGTAGNLITLNSSTAGTRATLSDGIGTVEVSNVSIKDINATGGATWNAFLKSGNVDAGNNSGWDFFPAVRQVFSQVFTSIFRPIF